jgi:hypothetical protein
MTMLAVTVVEARPSAQAAAPGITFHLRIENVAETRVHTIVLRCQVRIEPRGRRYSAAEQQRLYELFGDPSQWDRTLRGFVWAQTSLVVPSFEQQIDIDLPVACTYDLEVASAKYLHALHDGTIPLAFLFSGTVFTADGRGFSVEPVSWDVEATFRMPAALWRSAMDQFFPGGGWLRLRRETIERLQAFRGRQAVVSWDEAIERLLEQAATEQTA